MAASYCTVDEIRRSVPDVTLDGSYDETLAFLAEAASRAIDRLTCREAGAYMAGAPTERYVASVVTRLGEYGVLLLTDEMAAEPTQVRIDTTGLGDWQTLTAGGDYAPWPRGALAQDKPYGGLLMLPTSSWGYWPTGLDRVAVTAAWGYSVTPPADIVQATALQAFRWFRRGQQGLADTGAVIELGQLRYTQRLDPDVETIVAHWRRKVL